MWGFQRSKFWWRKPFFIPFLPPQGQHFIDPTKLFCGKNVFFFLNGQIILVYRGAVVERFDCVLFVQGQARSKGKSRKEAIAGRGGREARKLNFWHDTWIIIFFRFNHWTSDQTHKSNTSKKCEAISEENFGQLWTKWVMLWVSILTWYIHVYVYRLLGKPNIACGWNGKLLPRRGFERRRKMKKEN